MLLMAVLDADINSENTKSSYHNNILYVRVCQKHVSLRRVPVDQPDEFVFQPIRYISENFRPLENNSVTVWIALDDADEETGVAAQFWNCHICKDCSMAVWVVDWLGFPNTMISMILVAMLQKLNTNGGKLATWAYIILYFSSVFTIHYEWQWFVIQTYCFPNWMYRSGFTVSGWPPNLALIIDANLIKHCLNLTWLSWFMVDGFIFHMLKLFNVAILSCSLFSLDFR